MSTLEDLIAAATPGADTDDQVLDALYDSLSNGTKIPNDINLIVRLTLAGVRRIDTRSKVTKQRVDFLWFALLLMALFLGAIAGLLAIHTNNFHDLFPAVGTFSAGAVVLAAIRLASKHIH